MIRRRGWFAAWLLAGTALPAVAAVAIFGCCQLPFHGLIHRVMPLCEVAEHLLAHHHDEESPATPPPVQTDTRSSVARLASMPLHAFTAPMLLVASMGGPIGRSSVVGGRPIGAFRCDDDVGDRLAAISTLRL